MKLSCCAMWEIYSRKLTYMLRNRGKFVPLMTAVKKTLLFCCDALNEIQVTRAAIMWR